ncbi:PAS domain-containing sensor histidine kinase [Actinomadura sp. KC345]|uniref:sensor histidine kinase n=1 Tax=Actinomadura sp. KC345 TaxID=2530371 RepID=UPI001051041E|nr:PAS domain-containing sensor histidine kinase [Actinomadura sp. KC345]TDC48069.1 PAS domain-containing sensor histidine kinase [Actinomadura sp. KC345]
MSWFFGPPHPPPVRPVTAEDWVPLARDLRRLLGSDLLWVRLDSPGGTAWVEASGAVGARAPGGRDALDRPADPGPIPRAALPEGWRAGVRVPLRGPGGREAGCLLLGWTRRSGRYRASRLDPGALAGAARTLGALWAGACAAHEAERSPLSAVIEHCDAAVMAVQDGRIAFWNAAMATLTGTPADRATGRRPAELFTLTGEDGRAVELAGAVRGTMRLATHDGRELRVRMSCAAPPGGPPGLLSAVFADESARRQVEDMRHLLLASACHELHGPLTTIRGHTQLLQDALPRGEDAAESLEAILDAEETLRRIVGDLVPLAGVDPPAPPETTTEPIDVASLLQRTLRSVPSVAARTLTTVAPGLTVCADPVRLRQCLLVVLGNAEKYAPVGRIAINAHIDGASSGVISIADQGPGIPEAERELVLRPYHRSADARCRPGAGLGLYIAEAAMTAMRGRIELTAAPGGGLDVRLRLPLSR